MVRGINKFQGCVSRKENWSNKKKKKKKDTWT